MKKYLISLNMKTVVKLIIN